MNVLFLDFDGVLNSMDFMKVRSRLGIIHSDKYGDTFDPRCVLNLELIIKETNAQIVISSVWKYQGLEFMKQMWKERILPGTIIGVTPNINGPRGQEIEKWLQNEMSVYEYAIIDDDTDMLPHQMNNFVRTDSDFGLSYDNAKKVIEIFGCSS